VPGLGWLFFSFGPVRGPGFPMYDPAEKIKDAIKKYKED